MSEEKKQPDQTNSPAPDHTVENTAPVPPPNQSPKVYAVTDLRALVKPELAEELSRSTGAVATCGTEFVCSCVPVETCACNTVSHAVSSDPCGCTGTCTCQCTGTTSLYWYPY
jgi:hypothetical protein